MVAEFILSATAEKRGAKMDAYFAFTDECGNYQKVRSSKFNKAHPFYVRATVIISFDDYLKLQTGMDEIKSSFGLASNVEIKWSHFGSAIKNNYSKIPHSLTVEQLKDYYSKVLLLLSNLKSVDIYYTLTDNNAIGAIGKVPLLKMHLQNALQKIQTTMADKEGFAIVIADDLNDETKALKQAVYELTLAGDYVQYTNIKKGLYIDFSNQCHGLQIADICAGVFTATLKRGSVPAQEKHKFKDGYDLFSTYSYMKTRYSFYHAPSYDVYKFGVKEVPNGAGKDIAILVSRLIENKFEEELWHLMHDDISSE